MENLRKNDSSFISSQLKNRAVSESAETPCYACIAEQVEKAIYAFIEKNNYEPIHLYLGFEEWVQLKNFADGFLCHKGSLVAGKSSMYNGLDIFIVNKDNHLLVA